MKPKAKKMPMQPAQPPPRRLLASQVREVVVCESSDSEDWGNWKGDNTEEAKDDKATHAEDENEADAEDENAEVDLQAENVTDSVVAAGNVVDADSVTDQVETYKQWNAAGDTELHQGILDAIQELTQKAEDRKSELGSASSNTSSNNMRPKWWNKRGTSSRGGYYGTCGLYMEVL